MTEEVKTGREVKAPKRVARCELCSRPLDDGEHSGGVCKFYKNIRQMAVAANGRVEAC